MRLARVAPPHPAPILSIVIAAFNRWDDTRRCLAALAGASGDLAHEIIVVDNASTDGTAQALPLREDVRTQRNTANLGFAKASNQGAAMARGEYLLFLNNETELPAGCLTRMIAEVERDESVAVMAGAGKQLPKLQKLTTSFLLMRAALFRTLGGFDAGFDAGSEAGSGDGGEDFRLCLQIWRSGRKILWIDPSHPDPSRYDRYLEAMSPVSASAPGPACAFSSPPGLTAIVVQLAPGQDREQARACVETITRCADRELEIKVVSTGDGRRRDQLASPHARHVAVVGADAVVTRGWLARQLALLAIDPGLSVVGPAMNDASGAQRIDLVGYRRLEDLPAFAARWAIHHHGEHIVFPLSTADELDPLCRVMPRQIFIDGLDAQIGRTPLRAGIAFDAFVHRGRQRLQRLPRS